MILKIKRSGRMQTLAEDTLRAFGTWNAVIDLLIGLPCDSG